MVLNKRKKNYQHYLELFERIVEEGFSVCAVLDIPRLFHVKLGLEDEEAKKLVLQAAKYLTDLEIPILLHLIDSKTTEQEREDYCQLGGGVIPLTQLLEELFALTARIDAVILEFEDKRNPLESLTFLKDCIQAGVSKHYSSFSARWLG